MKIKKQIKLIFSVVAILIIFFLARDINNKLRKINKIKLNKELLRVINLEDALQKKSIDVFFNLAKIYSQENDFDMAISLYERALQLGSFRANKVFELACAYEHKGRHTKAFEKFHEALALDPAVSTRLAIKWELLKLKKKIK